MRRCLECKYFWNYPDSEVEGYCEWSYRRIINPNNVCEGFERSINGERAWVIEEEG